LGSSAAFCCGFAFYRGARVDNQMQSGIGPMMTIREAATLLNVHLSTLRRWEKAGLLDAVRLGPRGHRRYARSQILNLADGRHEVSQPAEQVKVAP
jgi:excisionase family DNA binding protein